jgi:hypothetical protein
MAQSPPAARLSAPDRRQFLGGAGGQPTDPSGLVWGAGGIISFDFLTLYSAGLIYWQDIDHLYNLAVQAQVEQAVFAPTPMGDGVNVFSSPPHVALAYSIFNLLPYGWAFLLVTLLSILAVVAAITWIDRDLISPALRAAGLTRFQMLVLAFSFFPNLFGLFLGQNQAFSLLLVTGIVILSLREKWWLAGTLAGLLSYKPHFVIGFLILWLAWRKWKAWIAFGVTAGFWAGGVILMHGLGPYWDYLRAIEGLVKLPYGIGRYLETTLFALAATSLPEEALPVLLRLLQGAAVAASLGLAWLAHRARREPAQEKLLVYALAVLYPFLAFPHTLQYDLTLLILALALWAYSRPSQKVLHWAAGVYLGSFLLLAITIPSGVALLALLPAGMAAVLVGDALGGGREDEELPSP